MKLLCHCETGHRPGTVADSDWNRFDRWASRAGYASGLSAANDCGLWGDTVEQAVNFCKEQCEEVNDATARFDAR